MRRSARPSRPKSLARGSNPELRPNRHGTTHPPAPIGSSRSAGGGPYRRRVAGIPAVYGWARDLVYRLGLSVRRRPAEPLGPDEWWVRDLSNELGVSYFRFKDGVKKGYVHVRRVGGKRHLVIWADMEERERLGRLRDYHYPGRLNHYPVELTRPNARSDQERGRRSQPSRDENDDRLDRLEPAVPAVGRLKKPPLPV